MTTTRAGCYSYVILINIPQIFDEIQLKWTDFYAAHSVLNVKFILQFIYFFSFCSLSCQLFALPQHLPNVNNNLLVSFSCDDFYDYLMVCTSLHAPNKNRFTCRKSQRRKRANDGHTIINSMHLNEILWFMSDEQIKLKTAHYLDRLCKIQAPKWR